MLKKSAVSLCEEDALEQPLREQRSFSADHKSLAK